jgi:hypothetical protein
MTRSLREAAIPRPRVRAWDILKAIAGSQQAIRRRPTLYSEKESEEHE